MPEFKSITLKPLTGMLDTLSSADEIGFGNWRVRKNAVSRSSRNNQRGGGFRRLFGENAPYNNEDLHDQLTGRLGFYDAYDGHAMGGGDLSGYGYPYSFPSVLTPSFAAFPPPTGPICAYVGSYPDGTYNGCTIFYATVGYPYVLALTSVSLTNLVAHWKLNETSGTRVDTIAALNLSDVFASTGSSAGIIGNAAEFNGTDLLSRASSATLQTGNIKFAYTGWIYRTATGSSEQHIIGKYVSGGASNEFRVFLNGGSLVCSGPTLAEWVLAGSSTASVVPLNTWTFFSCWYDTTDGSYNISLNANTPIKVVKAAPTVNTAALNLGSDTVNLLSGRLDSMSFWKNGFPSMLELELMYHSGMGLDYPFTMAGTCVVSGFSGSFLYTSCQVTYPDVITPGYGYGTRFPLYNPLFDYDYIYCGQTLHYRSGCREAVTMLDEIVTASGRKLIAGTVSRVYEFNQSAGNWRILADGLGTPTYSVDQCGCGEGRVRGMSATLGGYLLYTNNFDAPSIYFSGDESSGCDLSSLKTITDLDALGINRAGGVVTWKGFTLFYDLTESGDRFGGDLIWSDLEDPNSFIEGDTSLAGRVTIAVGETILNAAPLGNWLMIYTDKRIVRTTLVGGDDVFNFETVYQGGNAMKYKFSLIDAGDRHVYLGESDIYAFTQFDNRPINEEWLTKAAGFIFKGITEDDATYDSINSDVCNMVTGGWSEETHEAWLSWPTGDSVCPVVSLRMNLKYRVADIVDHGFTAFLTLKPDDRPSVGAWIEDLGICARGSKVASGLKSGQPCTNIESAVVNPPLYIRNPTEDPDLPVHARSLCVSLEGMTVDDFCPECASPTKFVAASAVDFSLKQIEDDIMYREMLGGSQGSYDGYSCSGEYYTHQAFSTVFQTGAMDFRQDNEKLMKRVTIEAFPEDQSTPSTLRVHVGFAAQSKCERWRELRSKSYECQTSKTGAEHTTDKTRPDDRFHFPCWVRGKYLFARFQIDGIGGAGQLSEMNFQLKAWENNSSR